MANTEFITSQDVSITQNTKIVNITGSVDCSFVVSGTAIFLDGGNILLEAVSGTASNINGDSTITLRHDYTGSTLSNVSMVGFNTLEGLRDAIRRVREFIDVETGTGGTSANMLNFLTSTDPNIDITLNGITTNTTPWGYLLPKLLAHQAEIDDGSFMSGGYTHQHSSVANVVPNSAQIEVAEIFINLEDGKLYSKKDDGTIVIFNTGDGGSGTTIVSSERLPLDILDRVTSKTITSSDDVGSVTVYNQNTEASTALNSGLLVGSFYSSINKVDGVGCNYTVPSGSTILGSQSTDTTPNALLKVLKLSSDTYLFTKEVYDGSSVTPSTGAVITFQPTNGTITEGDSGSTNIFTSSATDYASVQWYSRLVGGSFSSVSGGTSISLLVTGDNYTEGSYEFYAEYTGNDGSTTNTNTVTLTVEPTGSVEEQPITALSGIIYKKSEITFTNDSILDMTSTTTTNPTIWELEGTETSGINSPTTIIDGQSKVLTIWIPEGEGIELDLGDNSVTDISLDALAGVKTIKAVGTSTTFSTDRLGIDSSVNRLELQADTSGNIGNLPIGLTYYLNSGSNTTSGDIGNLPVGLTYYSNTGSNTTSGDVNNLPVGLTYYLNTGSNTTSGDIGNLPTGLTFYSNTGFNTTSGDVNNLPVGLTFYLNTGSNTTSGDIGNLPVGLTYYSNSGSNTTFGDIGNLPTGLAFYSNTGSNTTSGDIGNLSVGLTHYSNIGSNTTFGDIDNLPSGLTYYLNRGSNTTSGDVNNLPVGLTYYSNTGSNTTSGDVNNLPVGLTYYLNGGFNTTSGDIGNLPVGLTYYSNTGSNTTSGDIGNLPTDLNYYINKGFSTTYSLTGNWSASTTFDTFVMSTSDSITPSDVDKILLSLEGVAVWIKDSLVSLVELGVEPTTEGLFSKAVIESNGATVEVFS